MPEKHSTLTFLTYDTEALENTFEAACEKNLQITHRLELRRLITSLWYNAEMNKQNKDHQNHFEPLKALTNFKANLV